MPQPVVLCQLAALLEGSPTRLTSSRIARENTINRPAVFGRQCGLRFRSPSYELVKSRCGNDHDSVDANWAASSLRDSVLNARTFWLNVAQANRF
jgi:hypothetical protein